MPIDSKTDLTNVTFGNWFVIGVAPPTKDGRKRWLCRCSCGKEKEISGRDLRYGRSKSCLSCARKGKPTKIKDETGNVYGRLTVLYKSEQNINNHTAWICKCSCGNTVSVSGEYLRNGRTKSCGCLKQSFGALAIEQLLTENNIQFQKEKTFPTCKFEESPTLFRFDFFILGKNYLIEFDGPQHYKPVGWGTKQEIEKQFQLTQKRDNFKNNWCIENKIPLIRIPYTHKDSIILDDLLLETSKFIYKGGISK